eukprot:GHVT01025694.1.p1 GENE.GHVT01025694.1~~GHVT01025694.1.p1  ORF type:complete len:921 (+),score=30.53 GHVT01025694.1:3882-6644(+)
MAPCLTVTSWTKDFPHVVMGIQHNTLPLFGVQFHPESIGTTAGPSMLRNFRNYTTWWNQSRPAKSCHRSCRVPLPMSSGDFLADDVSFFKNSQHEATYSSANIQIHIMEVLPKDPYYNPHHEIPPQPPAWKVDALFSLLFDGMTEAFLLDSSISDSHCVGTKCARRSVSKEHRYSYMGGCRGPLSEVVEYWGSNTLRVVRRHVDTGDFFPEPKSGVCEQWHKMSIFEFLNQRLALFSALHSPSTALSDKPKLLTKNCHNPYTRWVYNLKTNVPPPNGYFGCQTPGVHRLAQLPGPPKEIPFEFVGGYVGFLGYECYKDISPKANKCHKPPATESKSCGESSTIPTALWMFADRLVVVDHDLDKLFLVWIEPKRAESIGNNIDIFNTITRGTCTCLSLLERSALGTVSIECMHNCSQSQWDWVGATLRKIAFSKDVYQAPSSSPVSSFHESCPIGVLSTSNDRPSQTFRSGKKDRQSGAKHSGQLDIDLIRREPQTGDCGISHIEFTSSCHTIATTVKNSSNIEDPLINSNIYDNKTTPRLILPHSQFSITNACSEDMLPITFVPDCLRQTYVKNIREIQKNIRQGETYEACLTNHLEARVPPGLVDVNHLYRVVRCRNFSPFGAYIKYDPSRRLCFSTQTPNNFVDQDNLRGLEKQKKGTSFESRATFALCCSSPELFLHIDADGIITSKPIKGTARRGDTPEEDAEICWQLETSIKDRSENMMIVDLVRNDIGKVCVPGSVIVPKLMAVESYATVHQLVSTVSGRLKKPTFNVIDAVKASFPGGSMTGAPKHRTMEILSRAEANIPRGPYSGSIGYFSISGSAKLNIIIRTAVVTPEKISVGAGGAIVALSVAETEYDEMLLKGMSVLNAVSEYFEGKNRGCKLDSGAFMEDSPLATEYMSNKTENIPFGRKTRRVMRS